MDQPLVNQKCTTSKQGRIFRMPKNHFGLCGWIYLFWGKGWFESYLMTCLWLTYVSGRTGQSGTQLWFGKPHSTVASLFACLGVVSGVFLSSFFVYFFVFQSQDYSWILCEFQNFGLKQLNDWLLHWFIQFSKFQILSRFQSSSTVANLPLAQIH